jgi:hypothetical protein
MSINEIGLKWWSANPAKGRSTIAQSNGNPRKKQRAKIC